MMKIQLKQMLLLVGLLTVVRSFSIDARSINHEQRKIEGDGIDSKDYRTIANRTDKTPDSKKKRQEMDYSEAKQESRLERDAKVFRINGEVINAHVGGVGFIEQGLDEIVDNTSQKAPPIMGKQLEKNEALEKSIPSREIGSSTVSKISSTVEIPQAEKNDDEEINDFQSDIFETSIDTEVDSEKQISSIESSVDENIEDLDVDEKPMLLGEKNVGNSISRSWAELDGSDVNEDEEESTHLESGEHLDPLNVGKEEFPDDLILSSAKEDISSNESNDTLISLFGDRIAYSSDEIDTSSNLQPQSSENSSTNESAAEITKDYQSKIKSDFNTIDESTEQLELADPRESKFIRVRSRAYLEPPADATDDAQGVDTSNTMKEYVMHAEVADSGSTQPTSHRTLEETLYNPRPEENHYAEPRNNQVVEVDTYDPPREIPINRETQFTYPEVEVVYVNNTADNDVFVDIQSGVNNEFNSNLSRSDYESTNGQTDFIGPDYESESHANPIILSSSPWPRRDMNRLSYMPRHQACMQPWSRGVGPEERASWYYSHAEGTCKWFSYAGHLGNANRFYSRSACESLCIFDRYDLCQSVRCEIPRSACQLREDEKCKLFVKLRNKNPELECPPDQPTCVTPRGLIFPPAMEYNKIPPECLEEADSGNCLIKSPLIRYYYDVKRNTCASFYFYDCGGNNNRFETKSECMNHCSL